MDIHRPGPMHGWREFAKEVGVIVLGVAIALGGEQIVQALHWRHLVHVAREAIDRDLKEDRIALVSREAQLTCVDRKLDEIRAVLQANLRGETLRMTGPVGRPINWSISTSSWSVAVSSQAVAHMPIATQLDYADTFNDFATVNGIYETDHEAWRQLSQLGEPGLIGDADWADLRAAYVKARATNARLRLTFGQLRNFAPSGYVGLQPSPENEAATQLLCAPLLAVPRDAVPPPR